MSQLRWATQKRLETKRLRRLHQLSQKFNVGERLPDVLRSRYGFLRRRNAILALGHGVELSAAVQ